MVVTGLERFGLTEALFRRLGNRSVEAYAYLRTYDVTPEVRRLPITRRFAYLAARAERWSKTLPRLHPRLSFEVKADKWSFRKTRRWSQLPSTLMVRGPAREVLHFLDARAISSIHVTKVAGYHRRPARKSPLSWYCVRALVVIRVEYATSGMQNIEDRFVLVRASSSEDAKKRLKNQWHEYARPYLNPNGEMVSWHLDHIVDVYQTFETEIDPAGTEVYSKLAHRRMRPKYVWRPKPDRRSR